MALSVSSDLFAQVFTEHTLEENKKPTKLGARYLEEEKLAPECLNSRKLFFFLHLTKKEGRTVAPYTKNSVLCAPFLKITNSPMSEKPEKPKIETKRFEKKSGPKKTFSEEKKTKPSDKKSPKYDKSVEKKKRGEALSEKKRKRLPGKDRKYEKNSEKRTSYKKESEEKRRFSRDAKPSSERPKRSDGKRFSSGIKGDGKSRVFRKTNENGPKRPLGRNERNRSEDQSSSRFSRDDKSKRIGRDKNTDRKLPRKTFDKSSADRKSFRKPETPDYDVKKIREMEKKRLEKSGEKGSADVRLNKYIANAGVCARREADELIAAGRVQINGKTVTQMGSKVRLGDKVSLDGKELKRERLVYVLLNKPKDFLTTTDDPEGRRTVMDLTGDACEERVYPVGRLDRNTTGLLVMTNDGSLAERLAHPAHKVRKEYVVDLDKDISEAAYEKLQAGLELEDGPIKPKNVYMAGSRTIGLSIYSGQNRIIRRMFEQLGYDVVKLDRIVYGGLTKKGLPRGKWRYLSEKEIISMKFF